MNLDKKNSKFKIILITFCCLLGLSCFCSADSFLISGFANISSSFSISTNNYNSTTVRAVPSNMLSGNYYICVNKEYYQGGSFSADIYLMECTSTKTATVNLLNDSTCTNLMTLTKGTSTNNALISDMNCFTPTPGTYLYFTRDTVGVSATSLNIGLSFINTDILEDYFGNSSSCPSCPSQYTSLECQQEYSLIPISSVDSNYCESNNLCSSSDCPIDTGNVNWSALYINNIQHLGGAIIRIDIPEEISWDYTQGTGEFDLDIDGYNVDYDKMNQVLSVQNYKPTSEDFTQVIGVLAPYMQVLVFILFAFIVIKRLKNLFKSKF